MDGNDVSGRTITVRVPLRLRKRGGRKLIVAPEGAAWPTPRPRADSTMVKAIARAFRWRRQLENGSYATVAELAAAEKINASYVSRVLRITLLAPDILETILEGRQPATMTSAGLLEPFPVEWPAQRALFLPDNAPTA